MAARSEDQHDVTDTDVTAAITDALEADNIDAKTVIVEGANHDNIVFSATDRGQQTLDVIAQILANTS